ncbi:murein L,D-transpeptidase [Aurantiacibacter aquimixticola]|uniref:Murein L,D-transpeptidase n=2 Tax=Aurantiacibacter aquimixticola TaxID=1958945 RepID=A0A419RWM4_9SPHN|nr:murein L,D-transpeptidase [Aurantiacibacter aquimixticola]
MDGADNAEETETEASANADSDLGYEPMSDDNQADSMASEDERYMSVGQDHGSVADANRDNEIPDSEERPIMQAQVVLDREGFGPGVIDGKMGMSTENALSGFQEANDLDVTGKLDEPTKSALARWERIPATRVVTIPASWGDAEYYDIPEDTGAKAEMERLGYKSLDERLAERFHTTVEVLQELNPNGRPAGMDTPEDDASPSPTATGTSSDSESENDGIFRAGQQIRVPNIGADRISPGSLQDADWQRTLASLGVGSDQPEVDRIVVSKAGKTLKAYQGDELVALFTVSSGSSEFPLPLGEWDIVGEAYNPPYSYDPEVLNGDGAEGEEYTLPPGPNGPVGVVWIDLSKEHYGIHGTPDPETIGRAQSSGCVRLTNWDAARLAGMVNTDTEVIFEA